VHLIKEDISFSREVVESWLNYNKSYTKGKNYNTAENCLLHIGNLDKLWEWGTKFDEEFDI
jgi:hypothetical protein